VQNRQRPGKSIHILSDIQENCDVLAAVLVESDLVITTALVVLCEPHNVEIPDGTDVIILDVAKDEDQALMCCRSLKQQATTAHIPIIMLSTRTRENSIIAGFEAGAADYIFKPYKQTILKARLKSQFQLLDLQQTAEDANRAKSRFLANMSHDIRTPMNGILGMTRMVLETHLDDHQQILLNNVLLSAETLLGLLNDILDYSKIEAGQLSLQKNDFCLQSIFDNLISSLSYLATEKNIDLKWEIDAHTVPVYIKTDELRLWQILSNLVGNGLKFTASGAVSIAVTGKKQTGGDVLLHFKVIDSGIGLSSDELETIFDDFIQAKGATTRKYGGTGLGLAISKQLVQMLGGTIWVESQKGVGSVFHFTLPVLPGTKTTAIDSTEIEPADTGNLAVLLVEDNEINQDIAKSVLQRANHRVTIAATGLEALKCLSAANFDAVLMDVQLPEMDGITATTVIRGCERGGIADFMVDAALLSSLVERLGGGHLPIIAMTANAMYEDRQQCLAAGMDDYLTKPFTPEHIVRALNKLTVDTGDGTEIVSLDPVLLVNQAIKYLQNTYKLPSATALQLLKQAQEVFMVATDELRMAVKQNDLTALATVVHSLKGALLNLGLNQLAECAGEIELLVKEKGVIDSEKVDYLLTTVTRFSEQ